MIRAIFFINTRCEYSQGEHSNELQKNPLRREWRINQLVIVLFTKLPIDSFSFETQLIYGLKW